MIYLQLIGGLVMLFVAGDVLVRGAVGVAERLGIPPLIIGLTVVAFGTSAPELVISLEAALSGSGGIAVGNIVGSNIANVLLVLGMPALIATTDCSKSGCEKMFGFMLMVTALFVVMLFTGPLGLFHGVVLLGLLVFYLLWNIHSARSGHGGGDELDEVGDIPQSLTLVIVLLVIGLVGLPLGAKLTIDAAVHVARLWGVSETAIGLTVVALGTSLPELATSLMAAIRKHAAVAIGNVIGSNVFNILAIIGTTAVVIPVPVPAEILSFDIWVMVATTLLLVPFVFACRPIGRRTGSLFVGAYILYIALVYWFGTSA
ncbi:calcium/sodium antiporter [Coralliovum pocilloporae]|uniref:calcium/sodium antiporter n=1 Tax=Coralliovum pocilloporae TaxID=3066369 RepID=UPI0033076047